MTTDETIKYDVLRLKKCSAVISDKISSSEIRFQDVIVLPLSEYIAVSRNSDEVGKVLENSNYRDADVN